MDDDIIYCGNGIVVDANAYDVLKGYSWHLKKCNGGMYAAATVRLPGNKFKTVYMHRLLMDCPPDKTVDHINGDTRDNRRINLRIVDKAENVRLMHKRNEASKCPA